MSKPTITQIDALLPQTQCGLCGFKGCLPYAEALANEEAEINLCPPGGIEGLKELGTLLNKNPSPFFEEMAQKTKPPTIAFIREAECIGCTKCIQACPVDAIMGTGKAMHTVLKDECTGCELCIAPCPVDCIEMLPVEKNEKDKKNYFRARYHARNERLAQLKKSEIRTPQNKFDKKKYIQEALLRVKKKNNFSSLR